MLSRLPHSATAHASLTPHCSSAVQCSALRVPGPGRTHMEGPPAAHSAWAVRICSNCIRPMSNTMTAPRTQPRPSAPPPAARSRAIAQSLQTHPPSNHCAPPTPRQCTTLKGLCVGHAFTNTTPPDKPPCHCDSRAAYNTALQHKLEASQPGSGAVNLSSVGTQITLAGYLPCTHWSCVGITPRVWVSADVGIPTPPTSDKGKQTQQTWPPCSVRPPLPRGAAPVRRPCHHPGPQRLLAGPCQAGWLRPSLAQCTAPAGTCASPQTIPPPLMVSLWAATEAVTAGLDGLLAKHAGVGTFTGRCRQPAATAACCRPPALLHWLEVCRHACPAAICISHPAARAPAALPAAACGGCICLGRGTSAVWGGARNICCSKPAARSSCSQSTSRPG